MKCIVMFENEDWMPPLREALVKKGIVFEERFMGNQSLNMNEAPEEAVYINRMSPSSHTRGNQAGVAFVREFLPVLEAHGLPAINASQSFRLEVSKVQQDAALQAAGIEVPKTIAVSGVDGLLEASHQLAAPFITKHNQGGKGLGVQLFRSHQAFADSLQSAAYESSPDSINLLQQYIEPPGAFITRVEIVDGKFLYALRSSTEGGFELCPADACSVGDAFCPVGSQAEATSTKFQPRADIDANDPLVQSYLKFCQDHAIDVAGIEFVEDDQGRRYTYDINCTSNYNAGVEEELGIFGMDAIVALCEKRASEYLNRNQVAEFAA